MILAGGHHSNPAKIPYFSEDNKYFVKNTDQNEIKIIQLLQSQSIGQFIPRLIKYEKNTLYLENILQNYQNPCICDIKLGRRTYGLNCDSNSLSKKEQRDITSTSRQYGCRITGYVISNNENILQLNPQEDRHRIHIQQFKTHLAYFINQCNINVQSLIGLVNKLIQQIKQTKYTFYGASLLIYTDYYQPDKTNIKLVDFSYTYQNSEYLEFQSKQYDTDIVYGLKNIISLLTQSVNK